MLWRVFRLTYVMRTTHTTETFQGTEVLHLRKLLFYHLPNIFPPYILCMLDLAVISQTQSTKILPLIELVTVVNASLMRVQVILTS